MNNKLGQRLVVISNRLPYVVAKGENEQEWVLKKGAGGLVTALSPVIAQNGGVWIGWPGCDEKAPALEVLEREKDKSPYHLEPVLLTEEQVEKYYRGFSNETIWPLFHDLLGYSKFSFENWDAYQQVNRLFADAVKRVSQPGDYLWVHDYQLILVGQYLRDMNVQERLAYFLHIPFPSIDLYRRLPWKYEILKALLQYDLLGFQTLRDRRNFVLCVKGMIPNVNLDIRRRHTLIRYEGRVIKVGHYPISIDFNEFNEQAKTSEVADAAWYLHENVKVQRLILGVDRLDYTKGIPERFRGFERALEKYPELRGQISLLQVVVPSRTHVPDYQDLKGTLDRLAGRINGRFSLHGWTPLHYIFRSVERTQLLGYYRASDIALITPLRDGMNLVAKEYCAANIDQKGVLILSEFAGALDQLRRGALIVNPYDREAMADAIYRAYTMSDEERERRMRGMRAEVRRNNVHRWVEWFLAALQEEKSGSAVLSESFADSDLQDEITPFLEENDQTPSFSS